MFNGVNKKTIIQLVIIVVAFLAAGLVLYNGFFNNSNNAASQTGMPGGSLQSSSSSVSMFMPASTSSSSSTPTQSILPYGETLDFGKVLDSKRFQYNQINYPQLDPQNEVGIFPDSLITPLPVTQSTQQPNGQMP